MRAFIQSIDITPKGTVKVIGNLSMTNLTARLVEHVYINPPADGIWEYTLEVLPTSLYGAQILVPFSVEAPWTGDAGSNGVRILQPTLGSGTRDYQTERLQLKEVKKFTTKQENMLTVLGASVDKKNSTLFVDVQYTGGDFYHKFSLEWNGVVIKTKPPQYYLKVIDLSPFDPGKAIKEVQLQFDISLPKLHFEKRSSLHIGTVNQDRQFSLALN